MSGLLKTAASNKKMPLPLKIFEISDIVLADESTEVGARNERRLAAVNSNKSAGFEVVHGLLDRVMQLLEVSWSREDGYYLQSIEDPAFFPGRCANVLYKGVTIGKIGVLHPTVLQAFEINNPCSVVEINIEPFVWMHFWCEINDKKKLRRIYLYTWKNKMLIKRKENIDIQVLAT